MAGENTNKNKQELTSAKKRMRLQRFKEKFGGGIKFSFIFFSAVHVSTIIIAAIYYNNCPVEPAIPKYLLVMGIIGVVTKLLTLFRNIIIKYMKLGPILSFITTAELTVLIVGSYYIYREFKPNYDSESGDKYCNKTLYLFSFICITIIYSLLLLCVLAIGFFILGIVLLDKYATHDKDITDVETTTEIPLVTEEESKEKK